MENSTKRQIGRFLIILTPIALFTIIAIIVGDYLNLGTIGLSSLVIGVEGLILAIWSFASSDEQTEERIHEIVEKSAVDDWSYNDSEGVYTYKKDVDLRLEESDYSDKVDFDEPWVHNYENSTAYRRTISIYYGSTFIDMEFIIQADEHRVFIPIPDFSSMSISEKQNHFGKIINYCKDIGGPNEDPIKQYEYYLDRGGITIQNNN